MSAETQKRALAEQIWLDYFNQILLEQGLITARSYHRLAANIRKRQSRSVAPGAEKRS